MRTFVGIAVLAGLLAGCGESREDRERRQQEEVDRIMKDVKKDLAKSVDGAMKKIEQDVDEGMKQNAGKDDEAKYEIAKRRGDAMDICVQAGLVASTWRFAKNQEAYLKWRAIEEADCKAAGIEPEELRRLPSHSSDADTR